MDHKGIVGAIVAKMAPHHEEEDEVDEGPGLSEGLLVAAEDVLDVLDPYGAPSSDSGSSRDDETPLQKQQREIDRRANAERRRAKAEILGKALRAFFDLCGGEPHEEEE